MSKVTRIRAEYYDPPKHAYPRRTDWWSLGKLIVYGAAIWIIVAGLLALTTVVFGSPVH